MPARIWYELNRDAMYLSIWSENTFDKTRAFVAGEDGYLSSRNEPVPPAARHAVTTIMLQELLDAILAEGIRPSSNAWSAGHVSDLKAHIAFAERMATSLLPKAGN